MAPVLLWVAVLLVLSCHVVIDATASGSDVQVPISSPTIHHDTREQAATDDSAIVDILSKIRAWQEGVDSHQTDALGKSFITLTYAQSVDGCVAAIDSKTGETSSNLPLSGKSSLRLTHGLRSIHDAVLVGGTTFAVDNPRLNVRMWPREDVGDELNRRHQPRPVVLDTELKSLLRLREENAGDIRAQNPIVCCAQDVFDAIKDQSHMSFTSGVDILPCKREAGGRGLDLEDVLTKLRKQRRICSVMVEGGASTLSAFANKGLVHCICVTIAPKLIGGRVGLNAFAAYESCGKGSMPWCDFDFGGSDCEFVPGIGSDCIFLARWPK
mmetsp:Transcript_10584/g.17547  ORF Transcript_10584/g.17547 Transcript_10584/m.17547 type:complete len:326 (-) Transcript_10584:95-1072(-)